MKEPALIAIEVSKLESVVDKLDSSNAKDMLVSYPYRYFSIPRKQEFKHTITAYNAVTNQCTGMTVDRIDFSK